MRVRKFLNFIALFVFVINMFFIGFFRGIGVSNPFPQNWSGGTNSEELMFSYIYINILIGVFFLGKFIKEKILSNILCIFALILTFYPYSHIYLQKSHFFNAELEVSQIYNHVWMLDWASFLLVLLLLAYQFITSFQSYFSKKRKIN